MKLNRIIFICLVIGLFGRTKLAQGQVIPEVSFLTEFTHSGVLIGGYGGFIFGKRLSAGGFYSARTKEFKTADLDENLSVYGGYLGYTILQENKLSLGLFLRAGLSSGKFILIVPSVTFGYKFTPRLSATAMIGFRHQRNSSAIGIGYNFIKSGK